MNLAIMLEEIARRLDNPRVIGEPQFARPFIGSFDRLQVAIERRLGVHHHGLTRGQTHQQIGPQAPVLAEQGRL